MNYIFILYREIVTLYIILNIYERSVVPELYVYLFFSFFFWWGGEMRYVDFSIGCTVDSGCSSLPLNPSPGRALLANTLWAVDLREL